MAWPEVPSALPWWGTLFCVLYFVAAFWLEDAFVVSSYRMYSPTADRRHGAVPAFVVGGEDARLIDFVGFHGIDPQRIRWDGFACSHQWMVHEARRWIEEHLVDEPDPRAVDVVWGFRVFTVGPEGEVGEVFEPVVRGVAVRR